MLKVKTLQSTLAVVLLVLVSYSPTSLANSQNRFDRHFQSAAKMFTPYLDYRINKSQCYVESHFRETAVSPVGAKGICQFMDGTWSDVTSRWQLGKHDVFDTRMNIYANAFYNNRLYRNWTSPRPERDRISLMLASYNAGLGNLLRAQRLCGMPNLYEDIVICLPSITGSNANETLNYVPKTWDNYQRLLLGLPMR